MDPTERILALVRSHTKNTIPVRASSTLIRDLEMDSLSRVELVMDIEHEYNLDIPDVKIEEFIIVRDLIDFVKSSKWWV